jgi:hypothetical protein
MAVVLGALVASPADRPTSSLPGSPGGSGCHPSPPVRQADARLPAVEQKQALDLLGQFELNYLPTLASAAVRNHSKNIGDSAMGYETSAPRTLPREDIRPAWRAAVLAYRREMRATRDDLSAWRAALDAFREALPEMPEEQAKQETSQAIAFAAANHTKWFWGGAQR